MKCNAIILGLEKTEKMLGGVLEKRGKSAALAEKTWGMYDGTCVPV
ncbi:hypothetical protein [Oscillibacter ruminantium]|jgi:hypothetical protein|nr:hypothetical protein [Oscillibacter ruminantium]MDN0032546.1 hypothetical protein [Oscillibacter valericigenes]